MVMFMVVGVQQLQFRSVAAFRVYQTLFNEVPSESIRWLQY